MAAIPPPGVSDKPARKKKRASRWGPQKPAAAVAAPPPPKKMRVYGFTEDPEDEMPDPAAAKKTSSTKPASAEAVSGDMFAQLEKEIARKQALANKELQLNTTANAVLSGKMPKRLEMTMPPDKQRLIKAESDLRGFLTTDMNYHEPTWGGSPPGGFAFDVMKNQKLIKKIALAEDKNADRSFYVMGRYSAVDFVDSHPSISRFHAVIQPSSNGKVFIWDLNSSHGTYVFRNNNNNPITVPKEEFFEILPGDHIRLGMDVQFYKLQCTSDPDNEFDVDTSICWDFVYGRCRKGGTCRWTHAFPQNPNYKPPANIVNVWEKRNRLQSHFQKR